MFKISKKPQITQSDRDFPYCITALERSKINLQTWREIPRTLKIHDLSEYVRFLKTQYQSRVDIRANHGRLPNQVVGLQISFNQKQDAENLLNLLIGR